MTTLLSTVVFESLENDLFRFRENILTVCCRKETSLTPQKWTPENPFQGHGALIACFLHEYLKLPLYQGVRVVDNQSQMVYAIAMKNKIFDVMNLPSDNKDLPPLQQTKQMTLEDVLKKGSVGTFYSLFKQTAWETVNQRRFVFSSLAYEKGLVP